ncbi:MAG: hypothetical protein WCR52_05305 [Bacteroidota bacterium]
MTQERFIQLIDNPDLLATISYEELKTLAFAYPYAHNLRYLLALKAEQEQHPDASRNLQTAATYSLDRTRLFMLIVPKRLTPLRVSLAEKEEVLELRPIEVVERELEALAPIMREVAPKQAVQELELLTPETIAMDAPEPIAAPEVEPLPPVSTPVLLEPEPVFTAPVVEAVSMQAPDIQLIVPARARQSFVEWFAQFHPPLLGEKVIIAPPIKKTPARTIVKEPVASGIAQTLAEKSVSENKSVISETLARLLVRQGYKEKAINMYMRLSLAFPEKSAYFAAEIEKLKK